MSIYIPSLLSSLPLPHPSPLRLSQSSELSPCAIEHLPTSYMSVLLFQFCGDQTCESSDFSFIFLLFVISERNLELLAEDDLNYRPLDSPSCSHASLLSRELALNLRNGPIAHDCRGRSSKEGHPCCFQGH